MGDGEEPGSFWDRLAAAEPPPPALGPVPWQGWALLGWFCVVASRGLTGDGLRSLTLRDPELGWLPLLGALTASAIAALFIWGVLTGRHWAVWTITFCVVFSSLLGVLIVVSESRTPIIDLGLVAASFSAYSFLLLSLVKTRWWWDRSQDHRLAASASWLLVVFFLVSTVQSLAAT